jgi:hypothetical protein
MLVCNVSLRPPRRAIAADLAEVVTAADATATGNIVFATLVDDPASVGDYIDAYLGEIMLEAASAADAISSGAAFSAAVDETASAGDTLDATVAGAAIAREAMLAGLSPVFVNGTGSREAYINGVMVNL